MYRVLLVDDDWTHRYALEKLIKLESCFKVAAEAEDAEEAIDIINKYPIDAVFTDIRMPGMDGLDLLEDIHDKNPGLPVILVSSHCDFEYAKKGIHLGAFEYLVKPFEENVFFELLRKLKNHLDCVDSKSVHAKIREEIVMNLISYMGDWNQIESYVYLLIEKHGHLEFLKQCTVFAELIDDLESKILRDFPFIEKLYSKPTHIHSIRMHGTKESVAAAIIKDLEHMMSFVTLLHLNVNDDIVKKLCIYSITDLENRPTLEKAAEALSYNSDYLGKLFKQKTGESFSVYCSKLKMELAKKCLRSNSYKIYEISEMLGFSDTDYFSKVYKESTGFSPAEYRKHHNVCGEYQ